MVRGPTAAAVTADLMNIWLKIRVARNGPASERTLALSVILVPVKTAPGECGIHGIGGSVFLRVVPDRCQTLLERIHTHT
jgi:hypothetical protein